MAYLMDTSAWIEYMEGKHEEFINNLLENDIVFTPTIALAEFSDKFHKTSKNISKYDWKIIANFIKTKTELVPIHLDIATEAGIIKARKRKKHKSIPLADCIIIATSHWLNAKIITTDPHILDEPNAIKF